MDNVSLYYNAVDRVRFTRQEIRDRLPETDNAPYLFILPFYLLFAIFMAFPVVFSLYLAFFTYNGISTDPILTVDFWIIQFTIPEIVDLTYVGLQNFERLATDGKMYTALYNTAFIWVVQLPAMLTLSLAMALALNAAFVRMKSTFRALLALPVAGNMVAYSTIFLLLFQEQFGLINYVLIEIGLSPIPWLSEGFWARMSIILSKMWRFTGLNMLILFAGLQNVPTHLYDAIEVDGANRWQRFRYVTLPQLKPVLLFVIILMTVGQWKTFAEPVVITGGGPGNSSMTILQYIYEVAFQQLSLGYAAALAWVFIILISAVSILQLRIGSDQE